MTSDEIKTREGKAKSSAPPPPKWKTAVLVLIAIYPLVMFLPGLLEPVLKLFPEWLGRLFSMMAAVALMTWVVMPVLNSLFKNWLKP